MLTQRDIENIELRLNASQKGPWKAHIEGRDHTSGCDFIMTGKGPNRGADLEITGATAADLDFIANAKQDIRTLIDEIKRLKATE